MTTFEGDPKYSVVSLFTGAGGLDVGFDGSERFELLACLEKETVFCQSLRENQAAGTFGSSETLILDADISTFDPHQLRDRLGLARGELDVLIGGPPCQAFSTAGRRQSVADARGTLLWDYLRFVEAFQPKVFVMENVRGLMSAALQHRPIAERPSKGGPPLRPQELPGSVIEAWVTDAGSAGYRVDAYEVNAVNYGAPQLRERVLFIGNRSGWATSFPSPTHGVDSALRPFATLRDAIGDLDTDGSAIVDFSPRKKAYLSLVPQGGNWRSLPDAVAQESMGRAYFAKGGRSGWWRRLSWDLPCPTITTLPSHASTALCHPEETRALNVTECASIQGFPSGWIFAGTPAEQMRQVGNAVPVRLGEVAADVAADLLDRGSENLVDPRSYTRTYLKSHVRTRRWYENGEAVIRGKEEGVRVLSKQLELDIEEVG